MRFAVYRRDIEDKSLFPVTFLYMNYEITVNRKGDVFEVLINNKPVSEELYLSPMYSKLLPIAARINSLLIVLHAPIKHGLALTEWFMTMLRE